MTSFEVVRAWGAILKGRRPSLSIEITRECPLHCPGCYAYEPQHLGGGVTLRQLRDFQGDALINGIIEVVDRLKPLHLSIVGGDPLVRYRELEAVVPMLLERGIHVQIVTSAFRPISQAWAGRDHLGIVVSIDGLEAEHDVRRAPATYKRILANIAGHKITVHCTITSQMMTRPDYLRDFISFWNAREETRKIWMSIFTPQRGDSPVEVLTPAQRARVIAELLVLRREFHKLDMAEGLIREFEHPPSSPDECIFARTTHTISADLKTKIQPCQFGGDPDCTQCGCVASMGLAAVGRYRLGGLIPLKHIMSVSARIGAAFERRSEPPQPTPFKIVTD